MDDIEYMSENEKKNTDFKVKKRTESIFEGFKTDNSE